MRVVQDLDEDFSQADDVVDKYPDKVRQLTALFWSEAEKYQVLPLLGEMATVWGFPKVCRTRRSSFTTTERKTFLPA